MITHESVAKSYGMNMYKVKIDLPKLSSFILGPLDTVHVRTFSSLN